MGVETDRWPLTIGCNGIACGKCSAVILPKPAGRKLPTDIPVIEATIAKHAPDCAGNRVMHRTL